MEEISVKGIVLLTAPQGEYGRRVMLLTDSLGKVTAFASGAAKQGSRLTGLLRPFTCAEFLLAKGRSAYNIHGAKLMESFAELSMDPDGFIYGSYVLETAAWLSDEGMPRKDAKFLLNLIFVTLKALELKKEEPEFIKSIYELKLMVLEGEYRTVPPFASGQTEGVEAAAVYKVYKDDRPKTPTVSEGTEAVAAKCGNGSYQQLAPVDDKAVAAHIWQYVIGSGLGRLYDVKKYINVTEEAERIFIKYAEKQFEESVGHRFKTLKILHDI